jgi:hypothetical protein
VHCARSVRPDPPAPCAALPRARACRLSPGRCTARAVIHVASSTGHLADAVVESISYLRGLFFNMAMPPRPYSKFVTHGSVVAPRGWGGRDVEGSGWRNGDLPSRRSARKRSPSQCCYPPYIRETRHASRRPSAPISVHAPRSRRSRCARFACSRCADPGVHRRPSSAARGGRGLSAFVDVEEAGGCA